MRSNNSPNKVQEFLKFKQSQTSLASTIRTTRPQKEMIERRQQDLRQLRLRNANKYAQLTAYQKEYEKLSAHVTDAIYQLKTQQDSIDKEIQQARQHKQFQKESLLTQDPKQKIQDLTQQIEMCREDKAQRVVRYRQDVQGMDRLIETEKKQFKELCDRVDENEKWLADLQSKHQKQNDQPINLTAIKNDIDLLRTANANIVREQATQTKRFRKEAEDLRRMLREYIEKEEQKIRSWSKKCQSVLDSKKQIKDILPESFYSGKSLDGLSIVDVEAQYLSELQAVARLYQPEVRNQLTEMGLLMPYALRGQPIIIRQSYDRVPLTELQEQIRLVEGDAKRIAVQIEQNDGDAESFKQQIEKYDKQINNLKLSIEVKKRQ